MRVELRLTNAGVPPAGTHPDAAALGPRANPSAAGIGLGRSCSPRVAVPTHQRLPYWGRP